MREVYYFFTIKNITRHNIQKNQSPITVLLNYSNSFFSFIYIDIVC